MEARCSPDEGPSADRPLRFSRVKADPARDATVAAGATVAGTTVSADAARGATGSSVGVHRGASRRLRLVAAALVFGLLLVGTVRGADDDFPFGPFRMYASRQSLDGVTSWYRIEAVTDTGQLIFVPGAAYGMRRAELEGQIPRFVAHPALLGELAVAYERRRPRSPRLVEIRLVRHRQRLAGGQPVGPPVEEVVATWPR